MEYIKATTDNIDCIFKIVQNTVIAIYPKYYPGEVVDFFCALHNRENISTHCNTIQNVEELIGISKCYFPC